MKTLNLFMLIAVCLMAFAACSSDDGPSIDTTPADIRITFAKPAGYSGELTLTDINTGKETPFNAPVAEDMAVTLKNVAGGYYRISATGKMGYRNSDLVEKTVDVVGIVVYHEILVGIIVAALRVCRSGTEYFRHHEAPVCNVFRVGVWLGTHLQREAYGGILP